MTRSERLKKLETEFFDLCIVGGGINGAGIARDAASRGMKVALVEAKDFAVGTSSRSSKLIHGGIRYLENFEFGLVFEALSERRLLFEIAPHLVHPLRFVIPLYKQSRVSPFLMGLGMFLYDALALFETPQPAERLSPNEAAELLPSLQQKDLRAAFAYSDAFMDDDRLVHETIRSAESLGATCINYVAAEGGVLEDDKLKAIEVFDSLTKKKFQIRAQHFVSTVGPWTDSVMPKLVGKWSKQMRPSKGVHLTFSRQRFPLKEAVVMGAEARIVFAMPRQDMVIVGTTDTDFPGDPYNVNTQRADVDYLLGVIDQYFPGEKIVEADIISSYSGVRPLVDDHSETESKTSREHQILDDPRNITVVMGGKYTTYRLIAEQAVDSLLHHLKFDDQVRFANSKTKVALNPKVTASSYQQREGLMRRYARDLKANEEVIRALVERHGEEAEEILEASLAVNPQNNYEEIWARELIHAVRHTQCHTLEDFYFRRTPLVLSKFDHGFSLEPMLAKLIQSELSLTEQELRNQRNALHQALKNEEQWRKV